MSVPTETSSYRGGDPGLLREIIASAEIRLQSQLTSALAADQRALVLGGFLSAASVALVSGAVALWIAEDRHMALSLIGLGCAIGFLIALGFTVYVARPVDWNYPGTRPGSWISDIKSSKTETERMADLCADVHRKIVENATTMRKNGLAIRWALKIAAISLSLSLVALLCVFLCT